MIGEPNSTAPAVHRSSRDRMRTRETLPQEFAWHTLSPAEKMPRIFVDQSYTARCSLHTGVHRVVRNIARYLPEIYGGEAQAVVADETGFQPLSSLQRTYLQRRFNDFETRMLDNVPKSMVRVSRWLCRTIRHPRLRSWLLPEPGHLGVYRHPLRAAQWMHSLTPRKQKSLDVGKGDVLLIPDAYWATKGFWPVVAAARAKGAYVCSIVYDLIPLDHPEFVAAGAPESFQHYLMNVGRYSDHIITISKSVREQVEAALPRLGEGSPWKRFDSFELGAEAFPSDPQSPSQFIVEFFEFHGLNRPYVMVATFEPRKNHQYVLEAFEHIWRYHPDRTLCLIGRVGWKCQDLLSSIHKHPRLGKQLYVFHDLHDTDVEYCYQNAKAILFPSIAEGFGLPIIEALSRGCYVFASDTKIHREVGGDDCFYSDLRDSRHLAEQIVRWESKQDHRLPRQHPTRKPLSWQESTSELLLHALAGWMEHSSIK